MIYPFFSPPLPEQYPEAPPVHVAPEMDHLDDPDGGADAPMDDWSTRYEPWLYIDIPGFGVVPVQQMQEVGSDAWGAFWQLGRLLEEYQPVRVHAPVPNTNNGAVVILMLPEACLGDFNDDGRVDLYDVPVFTQLYLQQSPLADLDMNGSLDAQDQILFLQHVTMPCVHVW